MLLLFITILISVFAIFRIIYACRIGARALARRTGAQLMLLIICYFTLLLAVSITSNEKVLGLNREKRFCGCYFDCHLSAAVTKVELLKQLGSVIPDDHNSIFYVVTVKIANDAHFGTLALENPIAIVTDAEGRSYQRDLMGEAQFSSENLDPFTQPLPPNSTALKKLVFALPADIKKPFLSLTEGGKLARFIELFIIGDDDSLFHKGKKFQLLAPASIIFTDDQLSSAATQQWEIRVSHQAHAELVASTKLNNRIFLQLRALFLTVVTFVTDAFS